MNTLKQRRGWHRERWTGETDRERHFLGRGVSGAEAAWSGGCRWALVWTPCGSAEMMGRGASWRSFGFQKLQTWTFPDASCTQPRKRVWKTRYREVEKPPQPLCPGTAWLFHPVAFP